MNKLTTIEQSTLAECEALIERNLTVFYETGQALLKIREARLYRTTHGTFEEYCRERWGMQRAHAYRLIESAQVVENLSPRGDIPTSERQARELASLEPEEQREVWQEAVKTAPNGHVTASHIREVKQSFNAPTWEPEPKPVLVPAPTPEPIHHIEYRAPVIEIKQPHVAHNSGNNEWYTPVEYVEAAFDVMSGIDLDPASSKLANEVIQASTIYTIEDDGLSKKWRGRVWMNPPYSGDLVSRFTSKLCHHYTAGDISQAIVLVNNATETGWFQDMLAIASALCLPKGRIRYWQPDRTSNSPLQGQAFLYFGKRADSFKKVFSRFGGVR